MGVLETLGTCLAGRDSPSNLAGRLPIQSCIETGSAFIEKTDGKGTNVDAANRPDMVASMLRPDEVSQITHIADLSTSLRKAGKEGSLAAKPPVDESSAEQQLAKPTPRLPPIMSPRIEGDNNHPSWGFCGRSRGKSFSAQFP